MEPAEGVRLHFSVVATTTPKLLVDAMSRHCVVICNNTSGNIRVGYSGTVSTLGTLIPTAQVFHDLFSSDEWWVVTESGTGTVSGYAVI